MPAHACLRTNQLFSKTLQAHILLAARTVCPHAAWPSTELNHPLRWNENKFETILNNGRKTDGVIYRLCGFEIYFFISGLNP